jgi:MFS family permease
MRGSNKPGPLDEPRFRLLWTGCATSELGNALVPVALVFAVISLGDSAAALGLVLASGFVSRIVFLPLGGVVADRLPRHRVMLCADALRAVTQACVALLLLTGEAQVWHLLVLFSLYGAGDAFFSPASTALVPQVVGAQRLQEANALLSFARSAAAIAGPVLAGVLVTTTEAGVVFALDAATFVVSGVALALLRLPRTVAAVPTKSILGDMRCGWREVAARTWVWTSIVYFAVSNLAVAPLFVLGPFVAEESLGGAAAWGLIATCAGIGSLLGDAAAIRLHPRRPLRAGYLALAALALEPALLARPPSTAVIAAAAMLGFGALSFANALWVTTLQQRVPGESLSRVSSYDWLGSRAFQPAGYALVGPVAAAIGIPATLLAGAALHAVASVGIALSPGVRRVEQAPVDSAPGSPSLAVR